MIENQLQQNGFLFVTKLISENLASELYGEINKKETEGKGLTDSYMPSACYFYKDERCEAILEQLKTTVEEICSCRLFKTYSLARQYKLGNELKKHKDREACEFTISILLGNEGLPWPLWIKDRHDNDISFIFKPGDALIFKGIELYHWRSKNTFGNCSHLFLHYVDQQGIYSVYKDDH